MPEGPELHLTMLSINKLCRDVVFSGKVVRNPIHKCAEVAWDEETYTIRAQSRGKELMLHLQVPDRPAVHAESRGKELMLHLQVPDRPAVHGAHTSATENVTKSTSILFTFGMSGKFTFTPAQELLKHSHLSFITKQAPYMALSFVDPRRFGKWVQGGTWSTNRGPCVIQEYDSFVQNIAASLHSAAFKRPICEIMLDQQFFNGIGNYLRAEILYRCQVPPFVAANTVLQLQDGAQLSTSQYFKEEKSSNVTSDMLTSKAQELLRLCHTVPLEVVNLGCSKYTLLDLTADDDDGLFADWMQCYYQAGMKSLADHQKRTIWFSGPAGPLVPTEQKSRRANTSKKTQPGSKVKTQPGSKVKTQPGSKVKTRVSEVSHNLTEELPGEALIGEILLDSTQSGKPKISKSADRRTSQSSSIDKPVDRRTSQASKISNGDSKMIENDNSEKRRPMTRKRTQKKSVKVDRDAKLTAVEEGELVASPRVTRSRSVRKVVS